MTTARATAAPKPFNPSACSAYSETAPYAVTTRSSAGLVVKFDYFGAGDYERLPPEQVGHGGGQRDSGEGGRVRADRL